MTDSSLLLKVSAAASRLGVAEPTVRAWIKNGSLQAVRPGRSLFVLLSAVERLERGETAQPRTAAAPSEPQPE
jgi:excisionase family DNA binding protein